MKVFVHPKKIDGFKQITSIKDGLKKLKDDLYLGGYLKEASQIAAEFTLKKYIKYTCKYPNCPWKLKYSKATNNQYNENIFVLLRYDYEHYHSPSIKSVKGEDGSDSDSNEHNLELLEQRKKHEQILHDQRAFGFLNRLIGLSYQQIGKYYAYLDDSICTTYLIGRISYELRKMMADPKKYTFFQWFQANKHSIQFISDCGDHQTEERQIQNPYFFFLTNYSWRRLYKERGRIVGVKTFDDRIIETIEDENYCCCVFYGLLPNLQMIIFAFCFYKSEKKIIDTFKSKFLNKQKRNKGALSEERCGKIDLGLYKSLRVFFQYMGCESETLVSDCDIEVINTIRYFQKVYEKDTSNQKSPVHVIDPTEYISKNIPSHLHKLVMYLMTDPQRYSLAKKRWEKGENPISAEQIECLRRFEQFYEQYPVFGVKNPSLIADWFQIYQNPNPNKTPVFNIKYLLNKLEWKLYKRSLAGILEAILFMGNKCHKIYKKSTYQLYHSDFLKIQNSCYTSQAFPHHIETKINEQPEFISWAKSIRNILFREGFGLVMEQLTRSGETDIIAQNFEEEAIYPTTIICAEYEDENIIEFKCKIIEDIQSQEVFEYVKYECSCKFTALKGIPCKHIWKICRFYKFPIEDYISKYWNLKYNYQEIHIIRALERGVQPKKRGKPKGTHTNKIK